MTRQRVFGVAAGYEDLNDHEALRSDQALQTRHWRGCDPGKQITVTEPGTLVEFNNVFWL
jgi:hypothetical protein